MREPNDTENYQMKIDACYLYVPIAQVSAPVYNEISTILSTRPSSLHFRKTEIRLLPIPKGKTEYNSDHLFPDNTPCRLIFCFIEENARKGSYSLNPFEFRRSWTVTTDGDQTNVSREEILERQLKELSAKIESLQNQFLKAAETEDRPSTSKGKKSGEQRKESLFGRLRSSLIETSAESDDTASNVSNETPLPPYSDDPKPKVQKTIYIKKVELTLNGVPIDYIGK